jgi:hypothetical protein
MKSAYDTATCPICKSALLMAPIGAHFGLCAGVCTAVAKFTPAQLQALRAVTSQILYNKVALEVEEETGITWAMPVPLTPQPEQPVGYDDDGTPRYRDMSSPTGISVRPALDHIEGNDPRLERYRAERDRLLGRTHDGTTE